MVVRSTQQKIPDDGAVERMIRENEERRRNAVRDEIAKLRGEAEGTDKKAAQLEALYAEFPDLMRYVGRWNKVAYYSKSVNDKVNNYESRHNCGCCDDSPLEVWCYVETPHGRVYADPPMFFVGERNSYRGGDDPSPGWDTKLREARIPESIIERVSHLFNSPEEEGDEEPESNDGHEN